MNYSTFNSLLGRLKRVPLLRALYRLPWAPRLYHFLLALVGAVLYRFPSRHLTVVGVTGTKGKTTVLELLNTVLERAGTRTALLSSVRIKIGEKSEKNLLENTQPGRFFTQHFLRRAVKKGCEVALLEVTSEGVPLSRHRFIGWDVGMLINLAPEHIESHGSFENYRDAKLSFLRYASRKGAMIFINRENQGTPYFFSHLPERHVRGYVTSELPPLPDKVEKVLPGTFNRENIAGVVSVARFLGVKDKDIVEGLGAFEGVRGRMDEVQRKPFRVVVDYAHTPDSLEAVYRTLRESGSGNMICVLGSCGGGRDKWKRPVMGKIAAEYCDEIVLTDEDPYDENPEDILDGIASGIGKDVKYKKILDRKKAITYAISHARPGDTVITTGKGSEHAIHIAKGKEIPWDERAVVEEILKKPKKTPPDSHRGD